MKLLQGHYVKDPKNPEHGVGIITGALGVTRVRNGEFIKDDLLHPKIEVKWNDGAKTYHKEGTLKQYGKKRDFDKTNFYNGICSK